MKQLVTGLATLVNAPVYRVWSEPIVHAGGCGVVPDAAYEIRSIPVGEIGLVGADRFEEGLVVESVRGVVVARGIAQRRTPSPSY